MNKEEILQKMIKEKKEELQRLSILRGYNKKLAGEEDQKEQRENIIKKVDQNKEEVERVLSYLENQLDDIK